MRHRLMRIMTTVTAIVIAVVIAPEAAQAAPRDGQDPIASGCASTASTPRSVPIRANGTVVGRVDLRYSSGCRTVWGRVLAYYTPYQAVAYVYRNSDGAFQRCANAAWSNTLFAYTCYTLMLNDANVTSYAWGYAAEPSSLIVGYAETGSY
jgi:hypothetical protein